MLSLALRIAVGLSAPGIALAQAELPETPGPGGAELLSFAGSLIVVVLSILAFGWLYGKLRPGMAGGSEMIRVVATRPLGPKERLVVVDLDGEQLLVGVSQGHMQTLHKLDRPIAAERPRSAPETGFAQRLKGALRESLQ